MPPEQIVSAIRLIRLPLRPEIVGAVQRRLARVRPGAGLLELAHELGDVRFASRFAPPQRAGGEGERWGGALGVFNLVGGTAPAILGYSIHALEELAEVQPPDGWPADPIDWSAAQEASLLPRLERRVGLNVPFTTEVWPKVRVVDPGKAPSGKRRVPRTRELDAATAEQAKDSSLSREAAYGRWLQHQLPTASVNLETVRITGQSTVPLEDGRHFAVLGLRLNGLVCFGDPITLALDLLRGVGRRKAYGCGLLVLA